MTENKMKKSYNNENKSYTNEKKSGCARTVLLVVVIAMLTSVVTVWAASVYLFPKKFKPVSLSEREERVLDEKLVQLDTSRNTGNASLTPERYSEEGANREVSFNEREVNALLARNTDLAHKLAIDLSQDLISAKLLVPMDPDFPMLGGKTLRFNAGLEMAYLDGRPSVVLKGVSIMGVPVPNAWLGGMKNVDLVGEFGGGPGFWKSFSEGVENILVEDGRIKVKLKE